MGAKMLLNWEIYYICLSLDYIYNEPLDFLMAMQIHLPKYKLE